MWLPARRLGDPTEAVLFDQVKPQDIRQGSSTSGDFFWWVADVESLKMKVFTKAPYYLFHMDNFGKST